MKILVNKRIELNRENVGALAFVCMLYHPLFNAGIYALLNQLSPSLLGVLMMVLVGFEGALIYGALLSYVKNRKNIIFSVIICTTVILLYLATFLLFPENATVLLGTIRSMVLFCVPSLLLAYFIDGFDSVWYYLHKFSYVLIIFSVLYASLGGMIVINSKSEYSMWLGYQLTIPVMVVLWNAITQLNSFGLRMLNLLFFVLGLTIIVIYGSRGPLLIIALYSTYCIYVYCKRKIMDSRYKTLMKFMTRFLFVVFLIMFALAICNVELLSSYLYSIVQDYGIQSRTLRVLSMDDALNYVSGRDVIYAVSIELIKENSLTGYGLAGDCVQIGRALGKSSDSFAGSYAHNFYLALMLHFGVLLGTVLFFSLICLLYKKYKVLKEGPQKNLFMILLFSNCVTLMISGNYLTYYQFWLLVGIALKGRKFMVLK